MTRMGIEKRLFHTEALPAAGERLVLRVTVILLVSSVVSGTGVGVAGAVIAGDVTPANAALDVCVELPTGRFCVGPDCWLSCAPGVEVA